MKLTTSLVFGSLLFTAGGASWIGAKDALDNADGGAFGHRWEVARMAAPGGGEHLVLWLEVDCGDGCALRARLQRDLTQR